MPTIPDFLTADDVAARLGVSRIRVYQLRRSRNTGTKIGNQWLFTEDDLARMQPDASHRRKDYATPPPPRPRTSTMARKLARGVWSVVDDVTWVARQEGDAFMLYTRQPDGLHPVSTFPSRDDLLVRMRQIEPDLNRWRLYA